MKDINEIASEILNKRHEIIDLFCKTFIISQEPKSIEEIKWLCENMEMEIKMDGLNQTIRLKLKS